MRRRWREWCSRTTIPKAPGPITVQKAHERARHKSATNTTPGGLPAQPAHCWRPGHPDDTVHLPDNPENRFTVSAQEPGTATRSQSKSQSKKPQPMSNSLTAD